MTRDSILPHSLPLPGPDAPCRERPGRRAALGGAAIAVLCWSSLAGAQETSPPPPSPAVTASSPTADSEIAFAADQLNYDSDSDIVTASGNVQMVREGNRLRADKVVWNRKTGAVEASGNVSTVDVEGNVAYGDTLQVTDTLRDGVVANLLLVMQQGGRLVARQGARRNGVYFLDQAAYTPCSVEDSKGCPKEPSWQIRAVKVRYDPVRQRVYYKGARIELFGIPLAMVPGFSHPVGTGGGSGFMLPDYRISGVNGAELALPYYVKLAPNRDMTLTPHVFTGQLPMMEASYRAWLGRGAYNILGYVTKSVQSNGAPNAAVQQRQFRGYIEGSGSYRFTPEWRLYGSLRRATDRTFLRRYNISSDDRLRSTLRAEHIDTATYFSLAGWSVQTMRLGDSQRHQPVALPVIDYRWRLPSPVLGGRLQLQANSLALSRSVGQDTQRAFAAAEWKLRTLTGLGQALTFTAYARGDVYHSSHNSQNPIAAYAGANGWKTRGIAAAAVDMEWPFVGSFLGGTQRITPHVQLVAAPCLANLALPNEDSRTVDLEDSNLFALNRFSGHDRFEDSSRLTVGVNYALSLKDFSLENVFGQSFRIDNRSTLLPDGTGLSRRVSDFVGRTTVRYKDFVSLTHRFRLDKDNLAIRRNEIDATVGSRRTYVVLSYLLLNRNVIEQLEDLADREEARIGARIAIARYWSVFGSTVVDLTDKKEAPGVPSDGFEPVKHRLGIDYKDDCLNIAFTWQRDYQVVGDARTNNNFQLRLVFRNLGI